MKNCDPKIGLDDVLLTDRVREWSRTKRRPFHQSETILQRNVRDAKRFRRQTLLHDLENESPRWNWNRFEGLHSNHGRDMIENLVLVLVLVLD